MVRPQIENTKLDRGQNPRGMPNIYDGPKKYPRGDNRSSD